MGDQKSSSPSTEHTENLILTRILFFGPLGHGPRPLRIIGNPKPSLLRRQAASPGEVHSRPPNPWRLCCAAEQPGRTAPQASLKQRRADLALSPRYRQRSTESRSVGAEEVVALDGHRLAQGIEHCLVGRGREGASRRQGVPRHTRARVTPAPSGDLMYSRSIRAQPLAHTIVSIVAASRYRRASS